MNGHVIPRKVEAPPWNDHVTTHPSDGSSRGIRYKSWWSSNQHLSSISIMVIWRVSIPLILHKINLPSRHLFVSSINHICHKCQFNAQSMRAWARIQHAKHARTSANSTRKACAYKCQFNTQSMRDISANPTRKACVPNPTSQPWIRNLQLHLPPNQSAYSICISCISDPAPQPAIGR